MSGDLGDRGLALCKALGLDPSAVIADTLVMFRKANDKGDEMCWAEYRMIVNGVPERDADGELVTHTIVTTWPES